MKSYFLCFCFGIFISTSVLGQENSKKFSISISAGFAVPIGAFASNDAEESAIKKYDLNNENVYHIQGFSKKENGFATTGQFFSIDLQYNLDKSWFVKAKTEKLSCPVDGESIATYYTQFFPTDIWVENEDFNLSMLGAGFGYKYNFSKFNLTGALIGGYGKCNYPSYAINIAFSDPEHIAQITQEGETPDLSSFIFGLDLSLNYNPVSWLMLGLECDCLNGNFDYTMQNRFIPGGNTGVEYEDTLSVRLLNLGLKVGFLF
jgi:hypothetical protein